MNKLFLVGIGPGSPAGMTEEARAALEQAEVLCGYTVYLDLVRAQFPNKETYTTPMTRELERCRWAVEQAAQGKRLPCSAPGMPEFTAWQGLHWSWQKEKTWTWRWCRG